MTNARARINTAGRRTRFAARHHLAPGFLAASPVDAARDLVGLHGTDPLTVYLSAWARVRDFQATDLERALYEDRSLLKLIGMRETLFVAPIELAAIIQAACTESYAGIERPRLARMIREAGISDDPERWIEGVEAETLAVLHTRGEATAAELTKEVEGLRLQIPFGAGKAWEGTVGVSTRLLFLLAGEGRIVRGRPKGTIASSLYRWVPMDRWVAGGLPPMSRGDAQAELVRRYLRSFGPATLADIRWWTGWATGEVRRAVSAIRTIEVDIDGGSSSFVLPDDLAVAAPSEPWVALLPALDPTIMGWQERSWYLGGHRPALFDRSGNAGPTIMLDGRVVGGWVQRRDGEIAWRLLEDVGAGARALVEQRAAELRAWLGDLRCIPRFRTPLEQELSS